jgi:PBP1b-binding outer membrane lipoprotein LpoB
MKKLMLVLFLALFVVSCTPATQQTKTNWHDYTKGNTP